MRFVVAPILVMTMTACATLQESAQQGSDEPPPVNQASAVTVDLSWVDYADPVADANLAIDKQDFQLLAFANRAISLAGIDPRLFDIETLKQRCGVKILQGTGDALVPGEDLTRRNLLRNYAIEYNQQMVDACKKHFEI